jgi:hypothetical protein
LKASGTSSNGLEAGHVALEGEDDDVASERKKIMTGATTENDVVVIKDIVKVSTSFNWASGSEPMASRL